LLFRSAEMQSIASQFRKNNFSDYSQIGNKPDAMFALYYQKKIRTFVRGIFSYLLYDTKN